VGVYYGFEYLRHRHENAPSSKKPDVMFVPTPEAVVDKMLELVKVTKDDVVWDLGCGDGRIVVAAAKRGAKARGFDVDPQRVKESLENIKKNNVEDRAAIEQKDIFTMGANDFKGVTVVTLYLLPGLNKRLLPVFQQLPDGVRIVSHDFDMQGAKPDQVVYLDVEKTGRKHTIYVWTTPLKPD